MLVRLVHELPVDSEGYVFEPKWDGFRCLVFRNGDEVDLRSRNDRPLARYFPELVEALLSLPTERFVIDGEIMILTSSGADFAALMLRTHPAASRVERLRLETPASFVAFDVVSVHDRDLRSAPFIERRALLQRLADDAEPPIFLTPATTDRRVASRWLDQFAGRGLDGVVAKHRELRYSPGKRSSEMLKVKLERTADCVVAGFRWLADGPSLGSLLLGAYEGDHGMLRHVGVCSSLGDEERRELLAELLPLVVSLEGHPWQHGFNVGPSPIGRLKGAAGRWVPGSMVPDWVPIAPERVVEVAYGQLDAQRFRHPARFCRWRPDREPRSCTLDQFDRMAAPAFSELMARGP